MNIRVPESLAVELQAGEAHVGAGEVPAGRVEPATATVGEVIAAFLERVGVNVAFGVISIHNMPILDAMGRRGEMRFVPARGEAGAMAMADAYSRVSGGLGIAITSTGTAAGNAAGALTEAQTAGSPVLHLTGQIELQYLDRGRSYIHEAVDQPGLLRAVSKQFFRVWSPQTALATVKKAVRCAMTAPTGPVSVEIPIDIQGARIAWPADLQPLPVPTLSPSSRQLDALAEALMKARRPLLWLGGGAVGASRAVERLVNLGFGVVTSTRGRGVLSESHPMSLGAMNNFAAVEEFYGTCDAMVVVGSRLRGNETLKYRLRLPPLYQIDADPCSEGRSYPVSCFVAGDAAIALEGLANRLTGRFSPDPAFADDLAAARRRAEAGLRKGIAPYDSLVDALNKAAPRDFVWVRDVTVSNSTWGNRLPQLTAPNSSVHAAGGGIGLGLPMAIGAAAGAAGRKVVALSGDGGLALTLGEIGALVQERANVVLLVMNDRGYGVIRNIQNAQFGGRKYFVDLATPNWAQLAGSYGLAYEVIASQEQMLPVLTRAMAHQGPVMVEVDMIAIGPFATAFNGPPARED